MLYTFSYNMRYRLTIFFLVFICCTHLSAQYHNTRSGSSRASHAHRSVDLSHYLDSLQAARRLCFVHPDSVADDAVRASGDHSRLSVLYPLNFHHGVSRRLFGGDAAAESDSCIDYALMQMYLRHPEWVMDSEKTLEEKGTMAYTPEGPVRNDMNMTSQADDVIIIAPEKSGDSSVELVAVKPNFWKFGGDYSLQFLQNYVSDNWYKGGESNYSMIGMLTVQANYNDKEKIKWDNKLELKLGMQSSQGDTLHTYKSSEDLIRLTSKLGIQATKRWYYTLQAIASTQFTHGYKANDPKVYSDFMSPLNVNLSLGMDYKLSWFKNHLTGTVNISPMAANMKYVDRLALSKKYGIDEGKHSLWDIGPTFTADLVCKFSDLIKWQTRLYAYTTYKRAEVEWENTFTFQLSKYISTKLFVYPRFDDSTVSRKDTKYGYFQLKEYWSLGFNYSF